MSTAILYVGIDLGNEHHALCVVNDVGKVLKERTVKNDYGAFEALQSLSGEVAAESVLTASKNRRRMTVEALMPEVFRAWLKARNERAGLIDVVVDGPASVPHAAAERSLRACALFFRACAVS